MINRILIRTKVVQLLYASLLTNNQFAIEDLPENATREKRFAYSLYLEALAVMAGVAGNIRRRGGDSPLEDTRFIKRITEDARVKQLVDSNRISSGNSFANAQQRITEKVKESGLYKKFLKSENPGSLADEKIWEDIFNSIIITDPAFTSAYSEMEGYSLSGVERMQHLMEDTFKRFYGSTDNLHDSLETLAVSMDKARELYFRLLDLPCRLTAMRDAEIEERRKAYLATTEDRNPNMRFVENALVDYLNHSETLNKAIEKYGNSWGIDDEPMLRSLLKAIMASDVYQEYMEFPVTDVARDCEFWRTILRQVVFVNPDFLEALEDKSVFWNDDVDVIGTFVLKTIKRISSALTNETNLAEDADVFLPKFKDEEDANFGKALFTAVVSNKEKYREYIDAALNKDIWESERMAYMDVVVMMAAVAEMINFPGIPLNVTINEYIEIAKAYSTGKSGQFVHAMLGHIAENLRKAGVLMK